MRTSVNGILNKKTEKNTRKTSHKFVWYDSAVCYMYIYVYFLLIRTYWSHVPIPLFFLFFFQRRVRN